MAATGEKESFRKVVLPVESCRGGILKTNRFLVLLLLVVVVFLTGVTLYQNHVIAKQSSELRWLLENCNQGVPAPGPAKK